MALCRQLPTGDYIHHCSNEYLHFIDESDANGDAPGDLGAEVRMLALYAANFGPFDERSVHHWLLARHLVHRCGWSIESLNEWLAAAVAPEPESTLCHRLQCCP